MKSGSLGINTRFASALSRIQDYAKLSIEEKTAQNRLIKWQRQSMAARIMHDQRVAKCYRIRLQPKVSILHSPKIRAAHYGGLMICGSVWMCPVCSAKITERRRLELESVNDSGLSRFMVTLTLQHSRDDRLESLKGDLAKAWGKTRSGRWWKNFQSEFCIVGSVAGTEVTYGLENGWHIHIHVLFWSRLEDRKINAESIRAILSTRFEHILKKMGRYVHPKHGVDVRKGDHLIREYVSKFGHEPKNSTWSLAAEITKAPAKIGLKFGDHYTPFQLLDLYLAGSKHAGKLFREYALTLKGTKQLVWGKFTRAMFGLDVEKSDEEIAAIQEQDANTLAHLLPEHWRIVLQKEKRAALLEVSKTGKIEFVRVFLASLGVDLDES